MDPAAPEEGGQGVNARAFYNENDKYAAAWLRSLIAEGILPAGDVDERDIRDVRPEDLRGYTQCHFFAGIGGWPYAARLAGWPDDRPIWTGSCPCQPFSGAGKRKGTDDVRHLWPDFFRLIRAGRPVVVMGEQVAGSLGYGWFDGVRSDLALEDYASRAVDIPACAVDAPHIRNRLYWVAERAVADRDEPIVRCEPSAGQFALAQSDARALADGVGGERGRRPVEPEWGSQGRAASGRADARSGTVEHGASERWREGRAETAMVGRRDAIAGADVCERRNGTFWSDADWIICHDGKARRAQSGIRLLADGIPARIPKWRAAGNSIVPQEAAEVIAAYLETR